MGHSIWIFVLGCLAATTCTAVAQTEPPSIARQLFTRLEALERQVTSLTSEVQSLRAASGVPNGAVIPFDRTDLSDERCPLGWSPFLEARARIIVGAGDPGRAPLKMGYDENSKPLAGYVIRQHGGEQKQNITVDQLPPHQHPVYQHAGYRYENIPPNLRDQQHMGAGDGDTTTWVHPGITDFAGGGKEINNMPPFVALYYCRSGN